MSVHFTQVGGRDVCGERLHAAVQAAESAERDAKAAEIKAGYSGDRRTLIQAEARTREAREAVIAARNAAASWFVNPHATVLALEQLLAQWLEAHPNDELANATREALGEDNTPQHEA